MEHLTSLNEGLFSESDLLSVLKYHLVSAAELLVNLDDYLERMANLLASPNDSLVSVASPDKYHIKPVLSLYEPFSPNCTTCVSITHTSFCKSSRNNNHFNTFIYKQINWSDILMDGMTTKRKKKEPSLTFALSK